MKKKTLITILGIEIIACIFISILGPSYQKLFTSVFAFPFEQISIGLSYLSLSNSAGNILSLILYAFVCLIPIMYFLWLFKQKRLNGEDYLLFLISLSMFIIIYLLINPYSITNIFGDMIADGIGKTFLGVLMYSQIVAYILMKITRSLLNKNFNSLLIYISYLVSIISIGFITTVFGVNLNLLITQLRQGQYNEVSVMFMILQYITYSLPYILNTIVIIQTVELINQMVINKYSNETINASNYLSRLCINSLKITAITSLILSFLQIVYLSTSSLVHINANIQLPITNIAFTLCVFILTNIITESKEIKDDNDMFV